MAILSGNHMLISYVTKQITYLNNVVMPDRHAANSSDDEDGEQDEEDE